MFPRSTSATPAAIFIDFKLLHFANAPSSITVTSFEIIKSVAPTPENAYAYICVKAGILTSPTSALQFIKPFSFTVSTFPVPFTPVIELDAKADAPISVIWSAKSTSIALFRF